MSEKPTILITNDDGIESPGLAALVEAFCDSAHLLVVAPETQQSRVGRSMPAASTGRIHVRQRLFGEAEITFYGVDGSPAQAVQHALFELASREVDLAVSGINYGENVGNAIAISGTIGAAFEASSFGIPALAVSQQMAPELFLSRADVDFSVAARFAVFFARWWLNGSAPEDVDLLKIDVPEGATERTLWRVTRVSRRRKYHLKPPQRERLEDEGRMTMDHSPVSDAANFETDSDVYALFHDAVVSVAPLSIDTTSRTDLGALQNLVEQRLDAGGLPLSLLASADAAAAVRGAPAETRVFLSYGHGSGNDLAERLYEEFNSRPDWSAWMDKELPAGDNVYTQEIERQIRSADCVVVVVSPGVAGETSTRFVEQEMLYARQVDTPIFVAKATEDSTLSLSIVGEIYVPFYGVRGFTAAFKELAEKISGSLSRKKADARSSSRAYLLWVVKEHSLWGHVYTTPNIAAEKARPKKILDDRETVAELDALLKRVRPESHVEVAYRHDRPLGVGAKDHTQVQTLETFSELKAAITAYPRVALVGQPGSGKTMTLRRIALDLAREAAADATNRAPLPLFAPLGGYRGEALEDYLETQLHDLLLADYLPERLVVLLDGLNETASQNVRLIQEWLGRNPKTRVVVTCRSQDYVERRLDLPRVDLLPLDPQRIYDFIATWGVAPEDVDELYWGLAGEQVAGVWKQWSLAGGTLRDFWTVDRIEGTSAYEKTTGVQDTIYDSMRQAMRDENKLPGLLDLVSNPFLLTLTIAIYNQRGEVPRNKAELFGDFVAGLMKERGGLTVDRASESVEHVGLEAVATYMQKRAQTSATMDEVNRILRDRLRNVDPAMLLEFAASAHLLERSDGTLRFSHQLLQEYFATYGMGEDLSRGVPASKYWPREERWWESSVWGETAVLLTGIGASKTQAGRSVQDPWQVVEWIAEVNPIVAWRCIVENDLDKSHPVAAGLMKPLPGVRAAPLARFEGGEELDSHEARSGVRLGLDGLPDLVWCEVPAGGFRYQVRDDDLPLFYVALYPVTYAQFRTFLDDPEGFRDSRWWTGLAEQSPEEAPQAFAFETHPRDRVNWYEAVAYSRWLDSKRESGELRLPENAPPGLVIRLPTEREWEKAARGEDGRAYPFGERFDPTKCNTKEIEHGGGHTSTVGIFPDGASPCGAMDMSGNVWEWCLNEHANPERTELGGYESRVLRGGSCFRSAYRSSTTYRDDCIPGYHASARGFRLVLAERLPPSPASKEREGSSATGSIGGLAAEELAGQLAGATSENEVVETTRQRVKGLLSSFEEALAKCLTRPASEQPEYAEGHVGEARVATRSLRRVAVERLWQLEREERIEAKDRRYAESQLQKMTDKMIEFLEAAGERYRFPRSMAYDRPDSDLFLEKRPSLFREQRKAP